MAERPRKRVRTSPPPSATSGVAAEPTARHEESSDATSGIHGRANDDAGPLARYSIPPTSHYASDRRSPTAFQQPLPLTSFSYSPRRELLTQPHERDASLSYYRDPQPGADLNVGYEEAVWRDGTVDEGLDALLESLDVWAGEHDTASNGNPVQGPSSSAARDLLAKTGLITWRGMLTKLMLAVYECENVANGRRADGWEMNAMLVEDCLYLEESSPPAKLAAKSASERSGAGALPSYYGYSFESYCTTSDPSASHTTEAFQVPNTNVQWCSVVKTNLGGVRTIVGGEVDCVLPPLPGVSQERFAAAQRRTTDGYVELKTNMVIQSQRDEVNFERLKLLKHYVQSFLLGVPTVTIGFRTRQGRLASLQSFKTLEIPKLVRGKPHGWDPAVCLASAHSLLAFIRQTILDHCATRDRSEDDDGSEPEPVFRIAFSPAPSGSGIGASGPDQQQQPPQQPAGVTVRLLSAREVEKEVVEGKRPVEGGRKGFLPSWWLGKARERAGRAAQQAAKAA
ncbi:decapping endonuclease targeting mRNA [Rhodotorula sphaerocarpa]